MTESFTWKPILQTKWTMRKDWISAGQLRFSALERHTLKTDDTPHDLVYFLNVHIRVILTDCVLLLNECQPGSDDQEDQGPEPEVSAKRDQTVF